jgi:hypothetical protein
MLEGRWFPDLSRMTGHAVVIESVCDVIRLSLLIRCKVRGMAGVTVRRRLPRIVSHRMARSAQERSVSAGDRERRGRVIETGRLPGCSCMARITGVRETIRDMVRLSLFVRCEVRGMAGIAIARRIGISCGVA